jgi:hypothetical protein
MALWAGTGHGPASWSAGQHVVEFLEWLIAESHLLERLQGRMDRRILALNFVAGETSPAVVDNSAGVDQNVALLEAQNRLQWREGRCSDGTGGCR